MTAALRLVAHERRPARPTYAPAGDFDETTRRNAGRDALLSLTSATSRVSRALSGSFTTTTKKAEAKRLLVEVERQARILRGLL